MQDDHDLIPPGLQAWKSALSRLSFIFSFKTFFLTFFLQSTNTKSNAEDAQIANVSVYPIIYMSINADYKMDT